MNKKDQLTISTGGGVVRHSRKTEDIPGLAKASPTFEEIAPAELTEEEKEDAIAKASTKRKKKEDQE